MKIHYSDYNNCITNLACSLQKEFGIAPAHPTLEMCDKLLQKNYKNIVMILLDGMGRNILEMNLEKDGFLNSHLVDYYSSVFPPTTVAATTSVLSGLHPYEHSWLGWNCYYKEIDKNVTVFQNVEMDTKIPAADFNVANTFCPYESIIEQIKENGGNAFYLAPFVKPYPSDFSQICQRIGELCKLNAKKYIYAYWYEPDDTMHGAGCYSEVSQKLLKELERQIEALCDHLEDTLVIVTADHGHIEVRPSHSVSTDKITTGVVLTDYPKITECLIRKPSIESRALNFFVKKGMEQQFEAEFKKEFQEKYRLFSKEQVREEQLFGFGTEHPRFDEMLGDYLAVAVSNFTIFSSDKKKEEFSSAHAGLTEEEMIIPFIAIET